MRSRWAPDIRAEIRFWIYLHVDNVGRLRGHVAGQGTWVEGPGLGLLNAYNAELVADALSTGLKSRVDSNATNLLPYEAINVALIEALEPFRSFRLERLYYLPGSAGEDAAGHVQQGVRVVLVPRTEDAYPAAALNEIVERSPAINP